MVFTGSDDPFEILGVSADADERAIKRAYARLIKVHRPDRAPAEFARIHAAFEAVLARPAGVFVAAPAPAPPPARAASEVATPAVAVRTPARPAGRAELLALYHARRIDELNDAVERALDDPATERDAIDALAVLVWWSQRSRRIVERLFASAERDPRIDALEVELRVAERLPGKVPEPLRALFSERRLVGDARRDAARAQAASLLTDPAALAATCQAIASDPGIAWLLAQRLGAERDDGDLEPPTDAERAALVAGLAATPDRRRALLAGAALTGVVAIAFLALALYGISIAGPGFVAAIGGVLALVALEAKAAREGYAGEVRPHVERLIARFGVPIEWIVAWTRSDAPGTARLAQWTTQLHRDPGLALFAAVAGLARPG